MQLDRALRDEIADIAERDFHGASLGEAVQRIVTEYKITRTMRRYEELRADPAEWAEYQSESRQVDTVAGERLPSAAEEYPEYQQ